MGKITLYDDTAKINAAYLYAASGNYSKVARDTNILIFPRNSGHRVKLLAQITSVSDAR